MPYVVSGLLAVVGVLALFAERPFPWLGAALLAGAAAVAVRTAREPLTRLRDWLAEPRKLWGIEYSALEWVYGFLSLGVIVAVAAAILPEAALGDRPVDHDHPVHFFKAWQLQQDFLADGRLWGWSHKWFAGYPAQYLYPIGADLWVNAVQWASLGLLELGQAYGVAFFLLWVLMGYSVYAFARVGFGRWVGVLGGVLFMADTASYRFGGWVYTAEWGVWPQALSTAFALLAMARVPSLLRESRWRDTGIFALFLGASLLTHPVQILHFAIAGPLILLAYRMTDNRRPWPQASLRLIAGYVLGILIGGLWVFPFMSVRKFAASYGEVWTTTFTMGKDLFELDVFPGTMPLVIGLGLVGSVGLLFVRKFHHFLTALLVFVFLLGGSVTVLSEFHLLELAKAFEHIQFQRFSLMLKPYWFVAAAYAAVAAVIAARRMSFGATDETDETDKLADTGLVRVFAATALPVLLIVPFAIPYFHQFGKTQLSRSLTEASQRPHQQARDELVAWFEREYPDAEPFFRIMLRVHYHDHSYTDLGTRLAFPLYKTGFTPVSNYAYKMEATAPELLDALNIRYVITSRSMPKSQYELVESFGELRLYEYKRWKEQPFEIIDGEGEVSVERFANEEIVLKAAEGSKGTLRLNVSYFPRWSVTRDGEPVDIEPMALDGFEEKTAFMTVPLEPGTYRFEFERSWLEWVSLLLFLVALFASIVLCVADTHTRLGRRANAWLERLDEKLGALTDRHGRALDVGFGAAVSLAIIAGLALAWWNPPMQTDDEALADSIDDVHYDFGDRLVDASVGLDRKGDFDPCAQFLDHFFCTNNEWNRVSLRAVDFEAGTIRRCIWAHPVENTTLVVHYPDVPSGDALVGYYGVAKSGTTSARAPVEMTVGIDGVAAKTVKSTRAKEISTFEIPLERKDGSHEVSFEIRADDVGRRHFCFNAQVVDQ
ncbi:hypothetical protein FRD00_18765 [Persicimonas caeni]|nr:hypothetical protein FRD00_18765 [Persicimonas caeni]